jgi:hypothetical protein
VVFQRQVIDSCLQFMNADPNSYHTRLRSATLRSERIFWQNSSWISFWTMVEEQKRDRAPFFAVRSGSGLRSKSLRQITVCVHINLWTWLKRVKLMLGETLCLPAVAFTSEFRNNALFFRNFMHSRSQVDQLAIHIKNWYRPKLLSSGVGI